MLSSLALALMLSQAQAGELAGVTMADTIKTDAGTELMLNGMGLREKYWIDIYVGGLYAPAKSTDPKPLISADEPKRIVMHFIYRKVTQKQMLETFQEGVDKLPNAAELQAGMEKLATLIDRDIAGGEQVVLDYIPGKGTNISIGGTLKGTIEGADFMRALWSIFLGDNPASAKLKKGMLGG